MFPLCCRCSSEARGGALVVLEVADLRIPRGSRPLHLVGGSAPRIWCAGVLVPGLLRRCVAASSGGGAKPGWWCVGGRSGVFEGSLLASPSLVAVGWWCWWREGALAVSVHRSRFRHRVADGSCGFFHAWRFSRVKVRWWFGYFVSGDGSGVDLLASFASCVCCTEVFEVFESLYFVFV